MKFLDVGRAVFRKIAGGARAVHLEQRRKYSRIRTEIPHPIILCHWVDGEMRAELHDLSTGGLRLGGDQRLEENALLSLTSSGGSAGATELMTVHARVRWCRKLDGGIAIGAVFTDKPEALAGSWVRRVLKTGGLTPETSLERRRDQRILAGVDGELLVKGNRVSIPISNLGLGGALVRSSVRISTGDEVTLAIFRSGPAPGLELPAKVVNVTPLQGGGAMHVHLRFHGYETAVGNALTRHLNLLLKKL